MGGAAPPHTKGAWPPAEWPAEWGQGFRKDSLRQHRGPSFLRTRDPFSVPRTRSPGILIVLCCIRPPHLLPAGRPTGARGQERPGTRGLGSAAQRDAQPPTHDQRGLQGPCKVFGEANVGNFFSFQKPEPPSPCLICSAIPTPATFCFAAGVSTKQIHFRFYPQTSRTPSALAELAKGRGDVGAPPVLYGGEAILTRCRRSWSYFAGPASGGGVCALPPACCPPAQHKCHFSQ